MAQRSGPPSSLTPRSLYDADPVAEADLWFLPADTTDSDQAGVLEALTSGPGMSSAWHEAQAALAVPLARVAGLGALDERLLRSTAGAKQRLALLEAAEISWLAGERISAERLALWIGLRAAAAASDCGGVGAGGLGGATPGRRAGTGGRSGGTRRVSRPPGGLVSRSARHTRILGGRLADWSAAIADGEGLHPFVRAAFGLWVWRLAGLSGAGPAGDLEAMVVAARLAADARGGEARCSCRWRWPDRRAARPGGSVADRLARWLDAAERSVLAALLHLDRLEAWRTRALAATAHLSGRTPPLLIGVLADWPLVSAPLAEQRTGASRAAVQRNIDLLAAKGLLREATGQGRYRMWAARL